MGDPYVDPARFRTLSLLRPNRVDELEKRHPGFLHEQLDQVSRRIEDQLRPRYTIPFPSRHSTIERWLVHIVQLDALFEIGIAPNEEVFVARLQTLHDAAEKQIADAANSQVALWGLPARDGKDASGISKGGAFVYSEQSPYDWTDRQVESLYGR